MRFVSIVGARPQFVKLAPVSRAVAARNAAGEISIEDCIVHTGQHYDRVLSEIFFSELDIPEPDIHLGIGSGSHGAQTAGMLQALEDVVKSTEPDVVVIYGDTNSTLAGALAAAKLDVPVAHVEAGLRSFDRSMPEEINRVVADHVSDLLLAPTGQAMKNLSAENLADRAVLTGDVMLDAIRYNRQLSQRTSKKLDELGLERGAYGVVTLHRAANTEPGRLQTLLDVLDVVAGDRIPLVFPVHPRTASRIDSGQVRWRPGDGVTRIEPVGYLDMLALTENAAMILTDSGGLQKEAFLLGVPCVTLRDETEWKETVEGGGNVLAGADPDRILAAVSDALAKSRQADAAAAAAAYYGDGDAAGKIVDAIVRYVGDYV